MQINVLQMVVRERARFVACLEQEVPQLGQEMMVERLRQRVIRLLLPVTTARMLP